MKKLTLAVDLQLGLEAVTQTFAFLARRGAGKTYGASKLAEEMLDADAQVVAIDPIGCWWALRVPEGKGKGCDIVVFGGLHGDLPLTPESGALVAEVVVERGISAVLDVSMMRKGDRKRFAAEFAERFFELKKSRKSPVHVFLEEAQVFVPQRVMPDEARMLGAFEDLVKLGRNFGIGCTLISQRPQAVNKDVLNQTECLVVLQTNGSQERKALKDWIVDAGMDVGAELVDSLPGLQRGEAWVWSPSWLKTTRRIHIAKKRTLNASATPEQGVELEARPLAPVDVEQLRTAMAATVAKAAASDPKALQRRIVELERELAKRPATAVEVKTEEKPVITEPQLKRLERELAMVETIAHSLSGQVEALRAASEPIAAGLAEFKAPPRPVLLPPSVAPRREPVRQVVMPGRDATLGKCERALLGALGLRHPKALTRDQVSILSGYSSTSSSFANALGALRSGGLIEGAADAIRLTSAGEEGAQQVISDAPQSPQATREMWRSKLGKAERAFFDALCEAYPAGLSKDELSGRTGYSATSSSFANALGRLRTLALVANVAGGVAASPDLFEAAPF